MAVVQISKIQVRRGRKNSSSGVPQLSSAEFAWAVDSQELFIGNGSVQEGAPYVGNTKIITEHDNILELANSYTFASDDPSITLSQPRTLLGKIDEIQVSVKDFGAVPDGSTDNVAAFERAFTELFRNADPNYKKVLFVPNGTYRFNSTVNIPSNTIIRGETQDGAVLDFDRTNILLITEGGLSVANFTPSDRPRNIQISNLTINRSQGQLVLTGGENIKLDGVFFKGEYNLGNATNTLPNGDPAAIFWANDIAGIKTNQIDIVNCTFENNAIAIKCNQTVETDTYVDIRNCKFFINDTSIKINGVTRQKNNWRIFDNKFEEIATQAFNSNFGFGTLIQRCSFLSCGNNTGSADSPVSSIIEFGESNNNVVLSCVTDRQQEAGVVASELIDGVTEVLNSDRVEFVNKNYADIYTTDSFRPLAVFSALNKYITVNYTLRLGTHVRKGNIVMTIGDDLGKISTTDNYQYSDLNAASPGGKIMENFEFSVQLRDNDTDSGIETVLLQYKNPLATGALGTISFDISYGV